ncbi:MAG: ABC transporter ATP-binding protein [Myxococcales bacterium]|nr:ABC transporter ATP-binding protein [Myxococcales bacterium]
MSAPISRPPQGDTVALSIRNLHLRAQNLDAQRTVLKDFSLDVYKGQTTALIGETGSGKTLAALSVLRILPPSVHIAAGEIIFHGRDILQLDASKLSSIRGNCIGMIFQEPETALNPLMKIGVQIGEPLRIHQKKSRADARRETLQLLEQMGISDAQRMLGMYPHQLSTGTKQRVSIAMALACRPEILLADAPTSALDATVQVHTLLLLSKLIQRLDMSVLLISHNISVVAALADRVAILHEGRIVETGPAQDVLNAPAHPYTQSIVSLWRTHRG